jgi:hypothetical protein
MIHAWTLEDGKVVPMQQEPDSSILSLICIRQEIILPGFV